MDVIASISKLKEEIRKNIIGQEELIDSLVIALVTDGNILLEGLPGLAKTQTVKALSSAINLNMNRVQFTPDLLPSDITGTEIYQPEAKEKFTFKQGPVFCNLLLADEINRAPAKVQSALLEAMEERQVTVAGKTYQMDPMFLVIATQNPIEQEGTYPLPEAQKDRFMMKVLIDYSTVDQEEKIVELVRNRTKKSKTETIEQDVIFEARKMVTNVRVDPSLTKYMVQLVDATRNIGKYNKDLEQYIQIGASPRGSISLDSCARAMAFLNKRDFVQPDDVRSVAHRVLRHRIALSYKAHSNKITVEKMIDEILSLVPVA